MAALQFQIHADVDKENVPSLVHKGSLHGSKTFQSIGSQNLKTPRRALGSVNQASRVAGNTGHELKASASKTPATTFNKPSVQKPKHRHLIGSEKENEGSQKVKQGESGSKLRQKNQQKILQIDPRQLPDIEYMPPTQTTEESDDESIWPRKDRVSTYVHRILSWRPPCLFGLSPQSDNEEEEIRERRLIMEELDNLPLPTNNDVHFPSILSHDVNIICENADLDAVTLPSFDEISIPKLDESHISPYSNLSLSLDDSVGLLPHLGSLQLLDDSASSVQQNSLIN